MTISAPNNSQAGRVLLLTPVLLIALTLMAVFISGWASQQEQDPYDESDSRKAAESNTSLGLEYMNRGQYEVALGKLKRRSGRTPSMPRGKR